jgi:hypothetical protein
MIHIAHCSGAYNAVAFEAEFANMVKQCMRLQTVKVVFVGDVCRIHSKDTLPVIMRQLVMDAEEAGLGHFDYILKFLPPYCPMLNPIELSFKDFKHEVRRQLDGPMHDRALDVVREPWGQVIHERAQLHPTFHIASEEITQQRTYAHEMHAVSLFTACIAREEP